MANDLSVASEPARWIKLRASAAERARWQALAASRGVSLSELIRASLGSLRLRARREPPPVAPELLRELARIGNNLNQLARAANRHEPVTATALLARLMEAADRVLAQVPWPSVRQFWRARIAGIARHLRGGRAHVRNTLPGGLRDAVGDLARLGLQVVLNAFGLLRKIRRGWLAVRTLRVAETFVLGGVLTQWECCGLLSRDC